MEKLTALSTPGLLISTFHMNHDEFRQSPESSPSKCTSSPRRCASPPASSEVILTPPPPYTPSSNILNTGFVQETPTDNRENIISRVASDNSADSSVELTTVQETTSRIPQSRQVLNVENATDPQNLNISRRGISLDSIGSTPKRTRRAQPTFNARSVHTSPQPEQIQRLTSTGGIRTTP